MRGLVEEGLTCLIFLVLISLNMMKPSTFCGFFAMGNGFYVFPWLKFKMTMIVEFKFCISYFYFFKR
jgi:hypothetical protein